MKIISPAWYYTAGPQYTGTGTIWSLNTQTNSITPADEAVDGTGLWEFEGADGIKPKDTIETDEPLWEYDSGLMPTNTSANELTHVTITMASPQPTFEIHKALSKEQWEYAKVTDDILITSQWMPCSTNSDASGVYIKADKLLETHSQLMTLTHGVVDREDTLDELTTLVGDGEDVGGSLGATEGNEISGITESWCEYAIGCNYYLYQVAIPVTSPAIRVYNLMFGGVNYLPEGYLSPDSTVEYIVGGTGGFEKLSGTIGWDGEYQYAVKRNFSLEFNYLPATEKDKLVSIWSRARGTRPVVLLDDNDKMYYILMPTMKVSCVGADLFNVSIKCEEL